MKSYTAESKIDVTVKPEIVWQAITTPELIAKYLFGTKAVSDWKKGSTILYKGEWQGKEYEDKGIITDLEPNKKLVTKYWSSMSAKDDRIENYDTVTYAIEPLKEGSRLTVTQDNCTTEAEAEKKAGDWDYVLQKLKETVEEMQ